MLLKVLKTDNVICFVYSSSISLMRAMIRFQEHYESPKFANKIFTLEQFTKWYIKNSPNGKKTKSFTYYTDWGGCNFTNQTIIPFRKGRFNPLTKNEQQILKELPIDGSYAVLGIEVKDIGTFLHEYAHAMFYLSPAYKRYATEIVKKQNRSIIRKQLLKLGYDKSVLIDETQAYLVDGLNGVEKKAKSFQRDRMLLKKALCKVSRGQLQKLFKQFMRISRPRKKDV